ncbi:MAG: SpoIVB peptidase S55 domain-containing protein [Armatimonadota bacterium]
MINFRKSIALIVASASVLIFVATTTFAAPWPEVSAIDAKNIMPVSEVKRGMRGYGLTVFHGTKIEKFDVLVLGVLEKMNTGRDLIMVRVGGGPITTRETGIMSGMSGSPVYINGKLIGAISYGSQFAKEPVGMVTPIADMLEAWDPNLPKHATGYSSTQSLPEPITIDGKTVNKVGIDPPGSRIKGIDNGTLYMQPLMTTMMVSGISARGVDRLADILRPFNIRPIAGPGGGGSNPNANVDTSLKPGAAVGMSLASGDIDLTGIGTVTYNRGGKILAFGHPMLGVGAVDAPMTAAYITDVISSYAVSTKLGFATKTVGRIFQDRPWCIAGAIGTTPKTIPVTISVNDESFKRDRVYHVKVINHPMLAPRLITLVTNEAIYDMHPTPGDATAEVSYSVMADQVGKISRSNVFFDPVAVDMSAAMDISSLLQILSANRFHPLDVHAVDIKVRIADKRNTATIDRIFVKKSEFEPGETVDVGVVLRPYKAPRVTKIYKVKIPATAANGKVTLMVRGGATPAGSLLTASALTSGGSDDDDDDITSSLLMPGGSSTATADNVQQLISKYLEREKNNEVVVQLLMRGTAMNIAGEKLAGLPSSIADVMRSSRNSGLKMEREEVKEVYANDSIIYGTARLMIDVKKKSLKEGKPAPKSDLSSISSDSSSDSLSSFGSTDSLGLTDFSYDLSSKSASVRLDAAEDVASLLDDSDDDTSDTSAADISSTDKADKKSSEESSSTESSDTSKSSSTPASNAKTVVRQMQTWTQRSQADFAMGTFAGVSASTENKLELAPTLKMLAETPEQFVWCLAADKDGVYAGTGDSGKIYKITDSGDSSVFYETGELEVHSIVRDSAGNIYAGTSPKGKIFKISPDGKGKMIFQTEEKYVLALALDPEGNLYAGVGDAGVVYKILPDGVGIPFVKLNEQQILSLSWDPHGSLLIGTGINGVVYRASRNGNVQAIFDAPEDSITAVVADGDGNAYAGTSPKGVIYKISPDGRSKTVYSKANRVLSMISDSQNNIYAVSNSNLVKITPDDSVIQLDSSNDKVTYLSLAMNEEAKQIYAGTGNIGSVYTSKCCDIKGTYESPIHDAKMISKWGRIKWVEDAPEGTSIEIRTRTGNVENPDDTWTDWSEPCKDSKGEVIKSAPGRYIQYKISLSTNKLDVSPRVAAVSITYLTPNQQPTVKLTAPLGGEVWAGKQTIKWVGTDPDKDKLSYDVFYSKDGGKSWKTLVGALSGADTETKSASEIREKISSELEKTSDVPKDMKKMFTVDPSKPDPGISATTKPAASSTSTSHNWNTAEVEDGTYVIKVVASDKPSNADDSLTDTIISDPFTICNKGPELKLGRKTMTVKGASTATITGTATSGLVEIAGVQYRVDGGDWAAASADSGMFAGPAESFTITTSKLTEGAHKVEVQAIDTAGNSSTATVDVKVS